MALFASLNYFSKWVFLQCVCMWFQFEFTHLGQLSYTLNAGVVLIQREMKSCKHIAHTDFLKSYQNELDIGLREDASFISWIVIKLLTTTFTCCLQKCMPNYTGGCHTWKLPGKAKFICDIEKSLCYFLHKIQCHEWTLSDTFQTIVLPVWSCSVLQNLLLRNSQSCLKPRRCNGGEGQRPCQDRQTCSAMHCKEISMNVFLEKGIARPQSQFRIYVFLAIYIFTRSVLLFSCSRINK